ncbi:MAG: hypothetical protein HF312_18830 [Ignavibacteria bacterium]|jgi:hypothetical protein|nr:hypothetical protein [Ignavibacteria bacterium]MCU7522278.1 hypothetical protein [Ignavibacteria bacterium]
METINKYRDTPKLTKAGHFSAYLVCPRRAWNEYYGQKSIKAEDPAYLKSLFSEGNRFEKKVYSKNLFADSVTISQRLNETERIKKTNDEIKSKKHKYIFQAYFKTADKIGIADILERTEEGGYCVGDIKASKEVSISYTLQIMWYNELLSDIQNKNFNNGFIILGNEERVDINYDLCRSLYERTKSELYKLKEITPSEISRVPKSHLCRNCYSCPWRIECMREIQSNSDLSLIESLSRKKISLLNQHGIQSWKVLNGFPDEKLSELGFNEDELLNIRKSITLLENDLFILREKLSYSALSDLIPISLDNIHPYGQEIKKVYYLEDSKINAVDIKRNDGITLMDIPDRLKMHKLALYGTDYTEFKRLLRLTGNRLKTIDMFSVIEQFVHAPFYNIDLISVDQFIKNKNIFSKKTKILPPESRLLALNNVIKYISKCASYQQN